MKKNSLITASALLILSMCLGIIGAFWVGPALAKRVDFDALLEDYTDQYIQSDDSHRATRETGEFEAPRRYIYEEASVKNLSHLFWAINLYKLADDNAIDEFMRINECDIYRAYYADEIEWKDIRAATKEFLGDNKADFPTRFEFTLPLKLADYSEKRQAYALQDEYKIESLRRFEVYATDFKLPPCTEDHQIDKGYPRVLVVEFSRPFNLVHVPMPQNVATDYMKRRLNMVQKRYRGTEVTRKRILDYRDAYLVLKVKIFTYGKFLGSTRLGVNTVQLMGVLEGFEIYETPDKDRLFFAQNYVAAQSTGKLNDHLKTQYELLLKKHKGEGLFH